MDGWRKVKGIHTYIHTYISWIAGVFPFSFLSANCSVWMVWRMDGMAYGMVYGVMANSYLVVNSEYIVNSK